MHQNVEFLQPGTDRDPVYSYTRQQLTAKIIQNLAPALYEQLHSFQKKVSLALAGLTSTEDSVLMTKYPECFEFSVLAAIPSIGGIPKWQFLKRSTYFRDVVVHGNFSTVVAHHQDSRYYCPARVSWMFLSFVENQRYYAMIEIVLFFFNKGLRHESQGLDMWLPTTILRYVTCFFKITSSARVS